MVVIITIEVVLVVEICVVVLVVVVSSLIKTHVFTVVNLAIGHVNAFKNNVIRQVYMVCKVLMLSKWMMQTLSRQKTERGVDTSVFSEFKCYSLGT